MQHWRERHRHAVLRELADRSHGVAWTRRLLNVLLEELHITDDASAVELLKHPVALLENPHPNPKLTTPADLPYLEFLLGESET